jgi:hypothetical protein
MAASVEARRRLRERGRPPIRGGVLHAPERGFSSCRAGRLVRRSKRDRARGPAHQARRRHPVQVKVTWTDGAKGEVNAWTSQWTHTHVCVFRETAPRITRSGCGPQTSGGVDRGRCREVPQMVTQVPQGVGRSGG